MEGSHRALGLGQPRMSSVSVSFPETQDRWDVDAETDVVTDRDPDAVRAIQMQAVSDTGMRIDVRQRRIETHTYSQKGIPGGSVESPPAMQQTQGSSSIPGSGRSPGGGHG